MGKLRTFGRALRARGVRGVSQAVAARLAPRYHEARRTAELLAASLRRGRPRVVLGYHGGIGDDVMVTMVARELRRRGVAPIWVMSRYPDVFEGNADVALVTRFDRSYVPAMRRLGWQVPRLSYARFDAEARRSVLLHPDAHIAATMCRVAGVVGPVELRPYINLGAAERAAAARVPRQIVIQSSGTGRTGVQMLNKEWFPDRFQAVVDALKDEFNFVQIGSPTDPPLAGALDLRGRTSRRESMAILSQSLTAVVNVGFLMHAARAVDTRAVVVFGGREIPEQSGYRAHENVVGDVPCSPCWFRNDCPYDRLCMRQIGPADVVAAVRRAVAKHGTPLELDVEVIPAEAALEPAGPTGRRMMTVSTPFGPQRVEAAFPPDAADAAAAPRARARTA